MTEPSLHIAVLMGGWSSERPVSLMSGAGVADALESVGHRVTRIDMDRDVALRALTVNPASFLGLDDRVGALAPGLDGDVVVWSGDPLDVNARAEHVLVTGAEVYAWDADARDGRGAGRVVERTERLAR